MEGHTASEKSDILFKDIDLKIGVVDAPTGEYRWYAWYKDEVEAFIYGSDVDEKFGELQTTPNFYEASVRDDSEFEEGSMEVRWYGSPEEPEGFDAEAPNMSRPFALQIGKLIQEDDDDTEDASEPEDVVEEEAGAYKSEPFEGQDEKGLLARVRSWRQSKNPDGEDSMADSTEEDGAMKEDEQAMEEKAMFAVKAIAFYHGTEELGLDTEDGYGKEDMDNESGYGKEDMEDNLAGQTTANSVMVKAVESRSPRTRFGHGITTADKYVAPIADCSVSGCCDWEAAAKRFGNGMGLTGEAVKASERLVYSNDEMYVEEDKIAESGFKGFIDERLLYWKQAGDVAVPKGTIMVMENIVTTTKKDRDNDVLRSGGAIIDPKMPLLWQHVQVQPIGKMLKVLRHDDEGIVVLSAIVDIGSLAQDAAKMVEAGMLRISHGFRPMEFRMMQSEQAKPDVDVPPAGFEVQKFEIMEESLVSVPANTDAVITMHSRAKFEDPIVKRWAQKMFDDRPVSVKSGLDLTKGEEPFSNSEDKPFHADDEKPYKEDEDKDDDEKAEADELSVGDFVEWDNAGGMAQGKITKIVTEGKLPVPETDFELNASEDDPAALIQVYDGDEPTDVMVGHRFSSLTKIDPLGEDEPDGDTHHDMDKSAGDDEEEAQDEEQKTDENSGGGCGCKQSLSSQHSIEELSSALCAKMFDATIHDLSVLGQTKLVLNASIKELRARLTAKYTDE